jgi:hypothetical protein
MRFDAKSMKFASQMFGVALRRTVMKRSSTSTLVPSQDVLFTIVSVRGTAIANGDIGASAAMIVALIVRIPVLLASAATLVVRTGLLIITAVTRRTVHVLPLDRGRVPVTVAALKGAA